MPVSVYKNSIRYLYNEKLSVGFRTPRYIIRDLIEPVVTDILNNPMAFPSGKYTIGGVNQNLLIAVDRQITDEIQKND